MTATKQLPSIDVHTHCGVDFGFFLAQNWPYAATVDDLLERLDRYGIDKAVTFPFVLGAAFDPYAFANDGSRTLRDGRFPYDHENAALIHEIEKLGVRDRIMPLAMFDPARRVDAQVKSLEQLAPQVAGLKTQTELLRSPIRNLLGEASGILKIAEAHDLPVLFHTAVSPNDAYSQVQDCLDIAEATPNVRFNLAHSLRFDKPGLERAAALPNVWVDCSAHLIHCEIAESDVHVVAPKERRVDADYSKPAQVLEAIHAILGDRYMWGSDTPFMSWCAGNDRLLRRYGQEVAVLDELPTHIRDSMTRSAPHAWLHGAG